MQFVVNNFNLSDTLLSGQCFRVYKENDRFVCILKDRVISVKQNENILEVFSSNYDDLEDVIKEYFDLNTDYEKINECIDIDNIMHECINKCKGYRILNQDSFEMCISYIISQNNNVKRISKSIELICKNYGKKIVFDGKEYYLFPSYEELKDINLDELRCYGVGFRDKYIRCFLDNYYNIKDIDILSTPEALKVLMSIKGIGLKVASCILLFGYKRLDVFPIDTWVKHFIESHYDISLDIKKISEFALNKFGNYSGLAIQYMYHSQRNL